MRSKTAQKHQCCTKLVLPTIFFHFFGWSVIIVGGGDDDDDQLLVCLVWSSIFTSGRSPLEGTTPICYQINKHFAHPPRSYTCMHNYWRHTLIYLCAHISHTCLCLICINYFFSVWPISTIIFVINGSFLSRKKNSTQNNFLQFKHFWLFKRHHSFRCANVKVFILMRLRLQKKNVINQNVRPNVITQKYMPTQFMPVQGAHGITICCFFFKILKNHLSIYLSRRGPFTIGVNPSEICYEFNQHFVIINVVKK